MADPVGYEDGRQIGARPYLERIGGDMVGPITFNVSGATNPHLAAGTGFGPLVLGKAGAATVATTAEDVLIGRQLEAVGAVTFLSSLTVGTSVVAGTVRGSTHVQGGSSTGCKLVQGGLTKSGSFSILVSGTGDAAARVTGLYGAVSSSATYEGAATGLFAGYNSSEGSRFAPVFVGSQLHGTITSYAALFTNQGDPVFAVFDRENPGSTLDHFLYLQRKRTAFSPITYYSLLASELGPLVLGSPTLEDTLNVDPVYTRDVAMAGVFFGIASVKVGEQGLVSDPGKDLRLRAGTGLAAGGGPTGALEAGGVRVRFGTFVADAGATIAGYIKAKEDDGTERFLAVVTAGD